MSHLLTGFLTVLVTAIIVPLLAVVILVDWLTGHLD